jgi:hypothetical protein
MRRIWPAHYAGWAWLFAIENKGGCGSWCSGQLVAVPTAIQGANGGDSPGSALERHHQVGIPFWAQGKKDSHHRRRPMTAHDGMEEMVERRMRGLERSVR